MSFFEGFYIKCQNEKETVAVIFGKAICKKDKSSFIQVITKENSYYEKFEITDFVSGKRGFDMQIGSNHVSESGMYLNINNKNLSISGEVSFGTFARPKYNVMGPLRFLPFLECSHTVLSMQHNLMGQITINGRTYNFDGGCGYIEGDRGRSFPKKYLWSQVSDPSASIFASCAKIPYLGLKFTGTVCVIHFDSKEYRLATYLGARVKVFKHNKLVIMQGRRKRKYHLEINIPDTKNAHPLQAPTKGKMIRTIKESVEMSVRYRFKIGSSIIFDITNNQAAYEYSCSD